jgi:hypothetical protein
MDGRWKRIGCVAVALGVAAAIPACATEFEATCTQLAIPRLGILSITGDVSQLLTFTQDGAGENAYDAGSVESANDQTGLTITANDAWDLSVRLAGTWTCPGSYNKQETDLSIRISNTPTGTIQNGAAAYITLTSTDTMILSHDTGVTDNEVDVQTRILLDWVQDVPGDYSIPITYTLTVHVP